MNVDFSKFNPLKHVIIELMRIKYQLTSILKKFKISLFIYQVWDHSLESLHCFIDALNSFHPSIKFTCSISTKKVNFLVITVSRSENLDFVTDVYVKSTNVHQYVEYSSCPPKSCKNGIPYSQDKRYRRIISNDTKFQENILLLRDFFP